MTEELIDQYLDTAGLPDLDLVIRTGGEMRLSNFLLWQAAYAEYNSTPICWPDFGREELYQAFAEFGRRVLVVRRSELGDAPPSRQRSLGPLALRFASGIVAVPLLLWIADLGNPLYALFIAAGTAYAAIEVRGMLRHGGGSPKDWLLVSLAACLPLSAWLSGFLVFDRADGGPLSGALPVIEPMLVLMPRGPGRRSPRTAAGPGRPGTAAAVTGQAGPPWPARAPVPGLEEQQRRLGGDVQRPRQQEHQRDHRGDPRLSSMPRPDRRKTTAASRAASDGDDPDQRHEGGGYRDDQAGRPGGPAGAARGLGEDPGGQHGDEREQDEHHGRAEAAGRHRAHADRQQRVGHGGPDPGRHRLGHPAGGQEGRPARRAGSRRS